MNSIIFLILTLLCHFLWCHGVNYTYVKRKNWSSPFPAPQFFPDPHFHNFKYNSWKDIVYNLTVDSPVLQYCTNYAVFYLYLKKEVPRMTLLLFLKHTEGERIVNITVNKNDIILDGILYFKTHWPADSKGERLTELGVNREDDGFVATSFRSVPKRTVGNGNAKKPRYEWVAATVTNPEEFPCYEVRVKVIEGYIPYFTLEVISVGFTAEPYDDTFYMSTSKVASTTDGTTTLSGNEDIFETSTVSVSEIHQAAAVKGFLYSGGVFAVLILTIMVSSLGYQTGRWWVRRKPSNKGLLKPDGINASPTVGKSEFNQSVDLTK